MTGRELALTFTAKWLAVGSAMLQQVQVAMRQTSSREDECWNSAPTTSRSEGRGRRGDEGFMQEWQEVLMKAQTCSWW
jgi:hypothetical protein